MGKFELCTLLEQGMEDVRDGDGKSAEQVFDTLLKELEDGAL